MRDQVEALVEPELALGAGVGFFVFMDSAVVTVRVTLLVERLTTPCMAAHVSTATGAGMVRWRRMWSDWGWGRGARRRHARTGGCGGARRVWVRVRGVGGGGRVWSI